MYLLMKFWSWLQSLTRGYSHGMLPMTFNQALNMEMIGVMVIGAITYHPMSVDVVDGVNHFCWIPEDQIGDLSRVRVKWRWYKILEVKTYPTTSAIYITATEEV